MRVVLLYPEVYDMARFKEGRREFPPFGVMYLGAALRDAGHDPAIMKVFPGQEPLDLTDFDAVGVSTASSATYGMLVTAVAHSRRAENSLLMVGGVHTNFYPVDSLVDFNADVVGVGESEDTILQLLAHSVDRDFSDVAGAVWRDAAGVVRQNPQVSVSRDISHLPLPARDLLPTDDLVMTDRLAGRDLRMAHVMFSRGCPFPCSFCAAGQTRIQYRDGVSARTELESLIADYQIEGFAIVDDNFIVAKQKVADICDHIVDLNLKWSALSRVDTVDRELLQKMADAGCIEVKFGVESGSEALLRDMQKNTTQAQIEAAITMAYEVGIEPKAFIIHGYPGENEATTAETIAMLERLRTKLSRVSLFRFVPLPGTKAYSNQLGQPRIHGTHLSPEWDGDWSKFHIHHNDRHWWGSDADFAELQRSYINLREYVETHWGSQGAN